MGMTAKYQPDARIMKKIDVVGIMLQGYDESVGRSALQGSLHIRSALVAIIKSTQPDS
jgi:hypothetical protein